MLGWNNQSTQHLRYGVQLLLQDSHWESDRQHSRVQWQSYWLAASVASPSTQKVAWHAGVGVGVLPIQQHYSLGQNVVRSRYTCWQQQGYAQLRYPLWTLAGQTQKNQLNAVLAANYVRLSSASIHERHGSMQHAALHLKAQARWQLGAGLQWQHSVQSTHAAAQLQLQSMAYWVVHQQSAHLHHGAQQLRQAMHSKPPVWQHSISLVAPSTKQGKITMQYGWLHGPRHNDHTLRIGAEWRF